MYSDSFCKSKEMITKKKYTKGEKKNHMTDVEKSRFLAWLQEKDRQEEVAFSLQVCLLHGKL